MSTTLSVNKGIDVNINTDTSKTLTSFEAKKFRSLVGTVNWPALLCALLVTKRFTSPSANCLAASYHLLKYL